MLLRGGSHRKDDTLLQQVINLENVQAKLLPALKTPNLSIYRARGLTRNNWSVRKALLWPLAVGQTIKESSEQKIQEK
jgi:hypothetical protein